MYLGRHFCGENLAFLDACDGYLLAWTEFIQIKKNQWQHEIKEKEKEEKKSPGINRAHSSPNVSGKQGKKSKGRRASMEEIVGQVPRLKAPGAGEALSLGLKAEEMTRAFGPASATSPSNASIEALHKAELQNERMLRLASSMSLYISYDSKERDKMLADMKWSYKMLETLITSADSLGEKFIKESSPMEVILISFRNSNFLKFLVASFVILF